jgi:hypothetical protein
MRCEVYVFENGRYCGKRRKRKRRKKKMGIVEVKYNDGMVTHCNSSKDK